MGEEYKEKANEFSNWLTAIIISIFAFLLSPQNSLENIRQAAWVCTIASLIAIFLFKFLGVVTALQRKNPRFRNWFGRVFYWETIWEEIRTGLWVGFFLAGLLAIIFTFLTIIKTKF